MLKENTAENRYNEKFKNNFIYEFGDRFTAIQKKLDQLNKQSRNKDIFNSIHINNLEHTREKSLKLIRFKIFDFYKYLGNKNESKDIFLKDNYLKKSSSSFMKDYYSLIKTLFTSPMYQDKLDKQSNKKINLENALGIKNYKVYRNHGFSYRTLHDEKVEKKRITNIESHIIHKSKQPNIRCEISKPHFSSYKQMNKSYNKYFSYTPNMVDIQK